MWVIVGMIPSLLKSSSVSWSTTRRRTSSPAALMRPTTSECLRPSVVTPFTWDRKQKQNSIGDKNSTIKEPKGTTGQRIESGFKTTWQSKGMKRSNPEWFAWIPFLPPHTSFTQHRIKISVREYPIRLHFLFASKKHRFPTQTDRSWCFYPKINDK